MIQEILSAIPFIKDLFKGARIEVQPQLAGISDVLSSSSSECGASYSGLFNLKLQIANKGNASTTILNRFLTVDGVNKFKSSLSYPTRERPHTRKADDRITKIDADSGANEEMFFEVDGVRQNIYDNEIEATVEIEFVNKSVITHKVLFRPKRFQDHYSEIN